MSEEPRRGVRRPFMPVALFALSMLLWHLRFIWEVANFDQSLRFILGVVGVWGMFICWVGILIWFFVISGLPRRVLLIGLIGIVLAVLGGVAAIAEVMVDGELYPHVRFRWEPRPEDVLDDYLAGQPDAGGLPGIKLTTDPVDDFPRYRGAASDGVVTATELLEMRWTAERKPEEVWRHPCGRGFSGFAVAGNVLVTLEQRDEDEAVVCYGREDGKQRWVCAYPAHFRHPTGSGPRATPAVAEDGKVYSLGALGDLVCVEGRTGSLVWRVNVLEDNQAKRVEWGMTSSPLVVEDLVVVNAGVDPKNNVGRSLVAYNRHDGKRVWGSGKEGAGYSSPMLATLAGRQQVLMFDAGGLAGFDVRTGQELWRHPWQTFQSMNIIQPVLAGGGRVFLSSESTQGGAMLKVVRNGREFGTEVVWANHAMASQYSNPIKLGNALYGISSGRLVCLDVDGGRPLWRASTRYGRGQILGVASPLLGQGGAGAILVQTETGTLVLVAANEKRFQELGRVEVFTAPRNWNTFAMAGRHLYLRNEFEMACYRLPVQGE